jgi:hypothetical protein
MAKYDILNIFTDVAGKYRVLVENSSENDNVNFKFNSEPSEDQIKTALDDFNNFVIILDASIIE